jgi:hypothetical protein
MSADNGNYVVKTPAKNGLAFEYRVHHAQAIENAEWYIIPERNEYLSCTFGGSWVFARQRRAVALAYVLEEEFEDCCGGYGTEYGVNVIPVDTVFPGADSSKPSFGDNDGVYVLKTPASWGEGYSWHVAYGRGISDDVLSLVSNQGRLVDVQESVANLLATFSRHNSMLFTSRGRAMRAAHLINDDIVSRGGNTAHGVVRLELAHQL